MYVPVSIEIDIVQGPTPSGPAGKLRLQDASGNTLVELDVAQLLPGSTLSYGPVYVEVVTPPAPTVAKTAAAPSVKKPGSTSAKY